MNRLVRFVFALIFVTTLVVIGCNSPSSGDGDGEAVIKDDSDGHGCISSAGYTWCESKQRCIVTSDEVCQETMTRDFCSAANGYWDECGNKCQLDNQEKEGVACTMQCEQLCECGGKRGFGCPLGYECVIKSDAMDAVGYCELR